MKAIPGQEVEFKNKQGDKHTGKVLRVAGDVYTIKTSTQTRPVHQKFVTKMFPVLEQETGK